MFILLINYFINEAYLINYLQLLLPFYGSLDFVWDYVGEPVPER